MAQPNVVREPSMDEILASIRRIIESNDPVPGIANGMPEPEGFSGSAANDDLEDVPLTIDDVFTPRHEPVRPAMMDVFPAEISESTRAAAPSQPEVAQQPKSLSLADVAARVRAASERNPGLRDLAPKPQAEQVAEVASVAPEPQASSPLLTGRMPASGGGLPVERPAVDWSDIAPQAEQRPQLEAPAVARAEPEALVSPSAAGDSLAVNPLISVDAGQQVARSFKDLAVAVDEAERRSYDEIAADLLRPMLQEWLDENLPTLVERLVREEIERVARGNRR